MKKEIYTIIILFLTVYSSIAQDETKVLFIGNSYTAANTLGELVSQIAASKGKTVVYQQLAPGGMTFTGHSSAQQTYDAMHENEWDYIVLQAQSQEPSFPPSQVATNTYPYAEILVDSVNEIHPCAEPIFFMTWGRKNGDAANAVYYPILGTYAGMQWRLRQSYMEMADDNDCTVAPVGAAWQWFRANYPSIDLYESDESHPNINGSYLAACVFYATIFSDSPVGATFFPPSLLPNEGLLMQQAAQDVVIDSLDTWRIGNNLPKAGFTYQIADNTVTFENADQDNNVVEFDWKFGDGEIDSIMNPIHTYMAIGNYNVILSARTECAEDTASSTLSIATILGLEDHDLQNLNIFPNPAINQITLDFNTPGSRQVKILSIDGKELDSFSINTSSFSISMNDYEIGIYILEVTENEMSSQYRIVKK
ncbi:MAG: T9SS type A sorting domain-containing protein [Bacteroidales bacterium]|nr:T9SS type A sorting domain-containing protein [Bacteroidales bacterium]MCF8458889.1 T9SS type A sorting domain-containing protein [Bacteroidales bacterium]